MRPFVFFLCIFLSGLNGIFSQSIDQSFKEPVPVRPAKIQSIKMLQDGKKLLGGSISKYGDITVNNLIRLNPDNSLDEAFHFGGNNRMIIQKIKVLGSGDIIILAQGYDPIINVYYSNYSLYGLNAYGDIQFQVDSLKDLNSIAVQDDDKILVCGGEYGVSGYVYRYFSDGSADMLFNSTVTMDNQATDILVDHNKIFVSGFFSHVNDTLKNDIVKLNLDGSIDTSFDTGLGTNEYIGSLSMQNDGKLILGKTFINTFDGIQFYGLARLNTDGSPDLTFAPPYLNGMASTVSVKDSAIFLAAFLNINSEYKSFLIKLKKNGELDDSFTPFKLDEFGYYDFCMEFENQNLIFNNSTLRGNKYGLSECDSTGELIISFAPEPGRYGVISAGEMWKGNLIIGGDFIRINNTETFNIALIHPSGAVDTNFIMPQNLGKVKQLQVLSHDTVLISTGSAFFEMNSSAQIIPDFKFTQFKTLYQVDKFRTLPDHKIMVGDPNNIFRLNPDGTEDSSFDIGSGIAGNVCTAFDFDIQNEKVIYGSIFTSFNGTPVNKLIRLNSDASVDQTFDIGSGPDGGITMIKVLNSGSVLIGGLFKNFNGIAVPHGLVKLNKDGVVDIPFNNRQKLAVNNGFEIVNSKIEQVDSILYIKGAATLKALNINGNFDTKFNLPFSVNNMNDIVLEQDSVTQASNAKSSLATEHTTNMFALGNFTMDNNQQPSFLIKLNLVIPAINALPATITLKESANSEGTFDISSNINWSLSSNRSWLSVNKTTGSGNSTVTITVTENSSTSPRSAEITLTGENMSPIKLKITQQGQVPVLQVSENAFNTSSDPNDALSFEVVSNVAWNLISSQDWLTANKISGQGNSTITLSALENTTIHSRTAEVTISGNEVASKVITITQEAHIPVLMVSSQIVNVPSEATNSWSVDISSNLDWTVSSDQLWLSTDKTSGSGNDVVTLSLLANESAEARSATLTLSGEAAITQTVVVNQEGNNTLVNVQPKEDVWLFPNPVIDKLNIVLSQPGQPASFEIFSVNGEILYQITGKNQIETIDLSNFAPGIYFYRISTQRNNWIGKMIKQ